MITSITTWTRRKAVGDGLEKRVREELERRGWTVMPYGQGQWPEAISAALRMTDSTMRHEVDLIAVLGTTLRLIDCKASIRGAEANQYTISRKTLAAHLRMVVDRDLPVYYVFDNLGVLKPWQVLDINGLDRLGGPGGAYLTVPAGAPHPFDEVFGAPAVDLVDRLAA